MWKKWIICNILLSLPASTTTPYLLCPVTYKVWRTFLSQSNSLAGTKAIWGASESLSNRITLSSRTLHGTDCRALRLPLPRLQLYLLLPFHPFNPDLHDWLQLKAPHARGGNQKHCQMYVKRPPAHQIKLHPQLWIKRKRKKGGNEKNKRKDKSLASLCDLGRQKNKLYVCVMILQLKIGIGTHLELLACVDVDIGSHLRAEEVHGLTFQPFILVSFVFHDTCTCCLFPLLSRIDCYYSKQHYLY